MAQDHHPDIDWEIAFDEENYGRSLDSHFGLVLTEDYGPHHACTGINIEISRDSTYEKAVETAKRVAAAWNLVRGIPTDQLANYAIALKAEGTVR
jgi:hypothetical protein